MDENQIYEKVMKQKAAKGGKNAWKDISFKKRSNIIKERWKARKLRVISETPLDYKVITKHIRG